MRTLVQLGYKVAARLRRFYWFVFRPKTFGVKCVVQHHGRWLMIRNSYGNGHWTLPGGGLHRGEEPEHAAIREVREEVGVELAHVESIGSYENNREYKHDTVYCFVGSAASPDHRIDKKEVIEAAWFDPSALPERTGPSVVEIKRLFATRTPRSGAEQGSSS